MANSTEVDALSFLAPERRERATVHELHEALVQAQEDFEADESDDPEHPYPVAYRAVIWHLVTELGRRGDEGRRMLMELLQRTDSPLCTAVARLTLPIAPTETREALAARAEELGDYDEDAPFVEVILEREDDLDVSDLFPEPEDQLPLLRLHEFKRELAAAPSALAPTALMARIRALAEAQGFNDWVEDIERLFVPGYALRALPADAPKAVGASKLGGRPALPAGMAWPTSAAGAPLSAIAQIRLSELAAAALPSEGTLYLFYDAVNQPWHSDSAPGAWQVVHHPSEEGLIETSPPSDAVPVFPEMFVRPEPALFPDVHWMGWRHPRIPEDHEFELLRLLQEVVDDATPRPRYQLLGDISPIQDSHPNEGQRAGNGYRLLFKVGSAPRDGMMWGDSGHLYSWVSQGDLGCHDFSSVLGVLHSY